MIALTLALSLAYPTPLHSGCLPDSRQLESSGGGAHTPVTGPCLTPAQRSRVNAGVAIGRQLVRSLGLGSPASSAPHGGPQPLVQLAWPIRAVGAAAQDPGVYGISNFVDAAPFDGQLLDHACGDRTYDGHRGMDIFSWPFAWSRMDADEVEIVAAAPGTIVWKDDGHFDEHCTWTGAPWNAVYIEHEDGSVAWYGHLKSQSLTSKPIGAKVITGERLGVMGSSGNSSGVHLHLELYSPSGQLVDPYVGPCNTHQGLLQWEEPRPYHDPAINRVQVGSAKVELHPCPLRADRNDSYTVQRGSLGYFTTFYRDQLQGQVSQYRIERPDGSVFQSWSWSSSEPHYAASWWWWSRFLPTTEPAGTWSFVVEFEGQTVSTAFTVL